MITSLRDLADWFEAEYPEWNYPETVKVTKVQMTAYRRLINVPDEPPLKFRGVTLTV